MWGGGEPGVTYSTGLGHTRGRRPLRYNRVTLFCSHAVITVHGVYICCGTRGTRVPHLRVVWPHPGRAKLQLLFVYCEIQQRPRKAHDWRMIPTIFADQNRDFLHVNNWVGVG